MKTTKSNISKEFTPSEILKIADAAKAVNRDQYGPIKSTAAYISNDGTVVDVPRCVLKGHNGMAALLQLMAMFGTPILRSPELSAMSKDIAPFVFNELHGWEVRVLSLVEAKERAISSMDLTRDFREQECRIVEMLDHLDRLYESGFIIIAGE